MAEAKPPVLPDVRGVDWKTLFGGLLPGSVGGAAPKVGTPGIAPGKVEWDTVFRDLLPGSVGGAAAQKGQEAVKNATPGGPLTAEFWQHLLADVQVYGFLMLLVAIALYGLFAPQINTAVEGAATMGGSTVARNVRRKG